MNEKLVTTASEAAVSYVSPLVLGAMLVGGAAVVGTLWYFLCGGEENTSSVNVERERKELYEKIKRISDILLLSSSETISDKTLSEAESLCKSAREKFDPRVYLNKPLFLKVDKLEHDVEKIREEKQYLQESFKQSSGYIV